jgi:hypothetical protein
MEWVTPTNGTRTTLNLQTGYTAIDKSGQQTHLSPSDLNQICGGIDKQGLPKKTRRLCAIRGKDCSPELKSKE